MERRDGASSPEPAEAEPSLTGLGVAPVRDVERGHEWTLLVLGGELVLVAPTRDVRRALDVSGVSRLLTIHDDATGPAPESTTA